jgi:Fic family protein
MVTGPGGRIDYRAPEAERVPGLMSEVVEWLQAGDLDLDPVIRAAMAHLHVVSVHPFRDGNGRISRIVQSLVLARDGILAPEFGSIEEWLGEHTAEFYMALDKAHGPAYQPERDAASWVLFCLDAHLGQAERLLARVDAAARRWASLEEVVAERRWPDRLVIALEQAFTGYTDRAMYLKEAEVSAPMANLDLRRLTDAGLIVPTGRGRATRYVATPLLRARAGEALDVDAPQ